MILATAPSPKLKQAKTLALDPFTFFAHNFSILIFSCNLRHHDPLLIINLHVYIPTQSFFTKTLISRESLCEEE
jgi:hypothetical protein